MYGTDSVNMTLVHQNEIINDVSDLEKAIVTLSIEKALIDTGKSVYKVVLERLENDKTTIPDFYENPSYLKKLLNELFASKSEEIIKSIKNYLYEFSDQVRIRYFINSIN